MTIIMLIAIIIVQFRVHLVALLFHLEIVLHVSIVEEAILVYSATRGLRFILVMVR
jgi:hypothetical protein